MKPSGYKTVLGLLIVQTLLLIPVNSFGDEVSKQFKKEFNTADKELLTIDNKYGDVTVVTWSQNKVSIEVQVTIDHPDQTRAEGFLSLIDVRFTENDNTIGAATIIDSRFSFRGRSRGRDHKFSIDYVVMMPEKMNLKLENRYGNVSIDKLAGQADITVRYGSLYAGSLTRGNTKPINRLVVAYGEGEVKEVGWSEIYLRYCNRGFIIDKAEALLIDSRSSELIIKNVSSVVAESKYDKFRVDLLNNMVAESAYTAFKLGEVYGKLDVDAAYGSFDVARLMKRFESVNLDTKYCSVNLYLDEGTNYRLNALVNYGNISYNDDRAEIRRDIRESNSREVEATVGRGNNPPEIKVRISYGSLKIF